MTSKTMASNTKCPFYSIPLLPISNNKVRVKVSVTFSLQAGSSVENGARSKYKGLVTSHLRVFFYFCDVSVTKSVKLTANFLVFPSVIFLENWLSSEPHTFSIKCLIFAKICQS